MLIKLQPEANNFVNTLVKDISIFEKKIHPLKQAAVILIVSLFLQIGYYLVQGSEGSNGFYWEVTFALMLFYALMDTALSFSFDN